MLLKEKKLIIIITICFLLIGTVFWLARGDTGYSSLSVLLRFENIHKGQYPDGTTFDKSDLIDERVLRSALEDKEGALSEIRAFELTSHLEVEALIPQRIRQRTGEAGEAFHPSEYRINLYQGENLGLSQEEQFQLLKAIVEEYEKNYRVHLGMDYPLPYFYIDDLEEILDYDYPFIPQILRRQTEALMSNVATLEERERTFQSEELGYTFGDIYYSLEQLDEIQIGNLLALIRKHNLSHEPDTTLRRYRNIVLDLQPEIEKKEEQARHVRDLLRDLEGKDLDPEDLQEEEGNMIEDLLRHDYYPDILKHSLRAGVEAEHLKAELSYYEDIIEGIEEGDLPEEAEARSLMEQADSNIESILASLEEHQEIINLMRQEAFQKDLENSVRISEPPQERGGGRGILFYLVSFGLLGILTGTGMAFFKVNRQTISKYLTQDKEADNNE